MEAAGEVEPAEASEEELLRRCRAGDKGAFGPIVRRYAGRAIGVATLMLGNREDALDASQEAFVRAWRAIGRFDPSRPFYPWYAAILRNVCVNRLRRRGRRPTAPLFDGQARAERDSSSPVLLAERNERRDRIWRAVQSLETYHREAIVHYHFEGMSYKQIAAALGVPVGTVMSRLHYARRALREKLQGEEDELR